jgi:hypothetical protein
MEYRENFTKQQHDAFHELEDIEAWFIENDYKINKYVIGEYTDESQIWIDYKSERKIKRDRHAVLINILG